MKLNFWRVWRKQKLAGFRVKQSLGETLHCFPWFSICLYLPARTCSIVNQSRRYQHPHSMVGQTTNTKWANYSKDLQLPSHCCMSSICHPWGLSIFGGVRTVMGEIRHVQGQAGFCLLKNMIWSLKKVWLNWKLALSSECYYLPLATIFT